MNFLASWGSTLWSFRLLESMYIDYRILSHLKRTYMAKRQIGKWKKLQRNFMKLQNNAKTLQRYSKELASKLQRNRKETTKTAKIRCGLCGFRTFIILEWRIFRFLQNSLSSRMEFKTWIFWHIEVQHYGVSDS